MTVAGDPDHPANAGRLCSKGSALGSTVGLEGRLLHPEIGGRPVAWAEAVGAVAKAFSQSIAEHGPDSVAFYVSGQILTEDYYAANKLMKAFIGSANIDTNSRLCMASAVAAHKKAFGADLVPCSYEDLEETDLVVFTGHNAAWTHPVLTRRLEAAKAARDQFWICLDPRRTDTAEISDLHLALKPQTDVRLWNGLAAWLINHGAVDKKFIAAHTNGYQDLAALLAKDDQSTASVALDCDLKRADVETFYRRFAATERVVTLFSQGANQSAQGVNKGLAIINAHLITGRIGKPGAAPFSITGQPNAMGGREAGGMATTLAAHLDFDAAGRGVAGRFWGVNPDALPTGPGLKAVDMFEAVRDGRIKAIWIMATNPVVSLPDANRVAEALEACPFVAVSDVMAETDTLAYAHVKLPALAWGEKDGTVTNSERCISRQRPVFAPPGAARADWRIVADVALAMGAPGFEWQAPADVFREYAALTTFENGGTRFLDLGPMADLSDDAYEALEPTHWPVRPDGSGTRRLFEDFRFQTPDGKARLNPVAAAGPARAVNPIFPFSLNTGRVRDHWHTLTRTGLAPELCRHAPEPTIDMHPEDAAAFGVKDGRLARLETPFGEAVALARLTDAQRRGDLFIPMHWTAAYAPSGRANPLTNPDTDPTSGQPEFKHTPARIEPYGETWRGFLISPDAAKTPKGLDLVWRRTPQTGCQLHEFAGRGGPDERLRMLRSINLERDAEVLTLDDQRTGASRRAVIVDGKLKLVLAIAVGQGTLPPRHWLVERFGDAVIDEKTRAVLLAGRMPGLADNGPVVCACANIGEKTIKAAIEAGTGELDALGAQTKAGVTCGSCRPELARMIAQYRPAAAPEKQGEPA